MTVAQRLQDEALADAVAAARETECQAAVGAAVSTALQQQQDLHVQALALAREEGNHTAAAAAAAEAAAAGAAQAQAAEWALEGAVQRQRAADEQEHTALMAERSAAYEQEAVAAATVAGRLLRLTEERAREECRQEQQARAMERRASEEALREHCLLQEHQSAIQSAMAKVKEMEHLSMVEELANGKEREARANVSCRGHSVRMSRNPKPEDRRSLA